MTAPSPDMFKRLLRYEPETGKLFWRERSRDLFSTDSSTRSWNTRFAGKEAFASAHGEGYLVGAVFNRLYLAHRVVFALAHGRWPTEVDHINGDRTDNRLANLREVTRAENNRNMKRPIGNFSGTTGVAWYPTKAKWRAYINADGLSSHLGYFASREDAVAARKAAERRHGYHTNHGR